MRSDPFPQSLLPGTRVAPLLLKFLRTLGEEGDWKEGVLLPKSPGMPQLQREDRWGRFRALLQNSQFL